MTGKQMLAAWIVAHTIGVTIAIGAVALALQGKDGWGWFLIVAALCSGARLKTD